MVLPINDMGNCLRIYDNSCAGYLSEEENKVVKIIKRRRDEKGILFLGMLGHGQCSVVNIYHNGYVVGLLI